MRIAILNKKGIDDMVDETIENLPINRRFNRVNKLGYPIIPFEVQTIPVYASYFQEVDGKSREVNLIGPYKDVPNFIVAFNEEDLKRIMKSVNTPDTILGNPLSFSQNQLIVLSSGVFFRHLKLCKRKEYGMDVRDVEGIYLSNGGYCVCSNKEKRQPKMGEAWTTETMMGEGGKKYSMGLGTPRIWEHVVEDMIDYFLTHDLWIAKDSKVLYDCDRSRDKVVEVFGKIGLKKKQL